MSILKVDTLETLDGDFSINVEDLMSSSKKISASEVSYTNTATGAVARTLSSKSMDIISVKDFGAVGDMKTDDTAAIQAAITAAASYSGRSASVYFPGGFYNVSATINVPSWVILIGAGMETTQIRCTDNTVSKILSFTGEYCGARFMTVRYGTKPTTQGTAVWVNAFHPQFISIKTIDTYIGVWCYGNETDTDSGKYSGMFFLNCELNDAYYSSLIIGATNSGFINDIYFHHGTLAAGSTDWTLGAVRILGRAESINMAFVDIIGGVRGLTVDPGPTSGLRFSDFTSVFFDSATNDCTITGANHTNFTDCWFSNGRENASPGLTIRDSSCLSFRGTRFYNNGVNGATVVNSSYLDFMSCTFNYNNYSAASTAYHLYFDGTSSHFNVMGCRSTNTTNTIAAGIFVSSGATYYNIDGNHMGAVTVPVGEASRGTTGRVVGRNAFYKTKASGSSSLAASSTSVSVPHGLAVTPTLADIKMQQNGSTASPLYVSAVTSSSFTVSTSSSNSSTSAFSWSVDASE